MAADPKPAPRIIDPNAGRAKLRQEGRCRLCGSRVDYKLSRHHLVPRGAGGDDVDFNLVPLCGGGTIGCHGDVEGWHRTARQRLRQRLTQGEVEYVIGKKGEAWLDRMYPPV